MMGGGYLQLDPHQLHTQPREIRGPQSTQSTTLQSDLASGRPAQGHTQLVQDSMMEIQSNLGPDPEMVSVFNDVSNKTVPVRRKSALASRQSRSRAASGFLTVKFNDIGNAPSPTPSHAECPEQDSLIEICETPLNTGVFSSDPFFDTTTPLRSGNHFTYPTSVRDNLTIPHQSTLLNRVANTSEVPVPEDKRISLETPKPGADQRQYHTDITKMRRALETQLNAVWLTEIVGDIIIRYYQGQRDELIIPLTQVTVIAEQYDLKILMARAQLWKALVFDELGNRSVIPAVLVDVFSLIRDHGDEMDCYHLRKLFPYYGEQVWQHLMKAAEIKRHGSNATFASEASQGAFQAWFSRQISSLEKRYSRTAWPDPFVARNAALASSTLDKLGLNFASTNASGNTTLIQHVMRLEDELSNERGEHQRKLQELVNENSRLRALQSGEIRTSPRTPPPAKAEIPPANDNHHVISPGRVTAMMEELKNAGPRARRTPQSSAKGEYATNTPTGVWIEDVDQGFKINAESSTVDIRDAPFATPTVVEAQYERDLRGTLSGVLDSDVIPAISSARPQPLRIRNAMQDLRFTRPTRPRQSITRAQARSPVRQRPLNRKSPPQTPQKFSSSSTSNCTPVTPAKPRINPMADKNSYDFTADTAPRRTSSLISPLTIDPKFELPNTDTDTPSPTKLRDAFPKLEEHQEQRRRSVTVLASPESTSYETERRRSHIAASLKPKESLEKDHAASLLKISETEPKQSAGSIHQCREASEHETYALRPKAVDLAESEGHCGGTDFESQSPTERSNDNAPIPGGDRYIADDGSKPSMVGPSLNGLANEPNTTPSIHARKNSVPVNPSPLREASQVGDIDAWSGETTSATKSWNPDRERKQPPVRLSHLLAELEDDYLPSNHPQSERSSSNTSLLVGPLELPTITKHVDILGELRSALEAQQDINPRDSKFNSLLASHLKDMEYTVDQTTNPNLVNDNGNDTPISPEDVEPFHVQAHPHESTFASDTYAENTSTSKSTSSKGTTKSGISEARTENYDFNESQVSETLLPRTYVPGSTSPTPPKQTGPPRNVQSKGTNESEGSKFSDPGLSAWRGEMQ